MNLVRFAVAFSLAVLQSGCAATSVPLATTPGSNATAAQHNSEGIADYDVGHWSVAREHFASAIKADPNLAESHFNLALALDKLDLHSEATTHFNRAAELAPGNSAITQSSAYRSHTASPSPSYGTGGYGGMGGVLEGVVAGILILCPTPPPFAEYARKVSTKSGEDHLGQSGPE